MSIFRKIWIHFLKAVFVTCQEATYLMSKKECTKLSFRESIRLRLHLAKCKYCNYYRDEQELLSEALEKLRSDIEVSKYYFYLTEEQKQRLNSSLLK